MGAAIRLVHRTWSGSQQQSDKRIRDILVIECSYYSFGTPRGYNNIHTLIPRGSTWPCNKTQVYSTYTDNANVCFFQLCEGERQFFNDNVL